MGAKKKREEERCWQKQLQQRPHQSNHGEVNKHLVEWNVTGATSATKVSISSSLEVGRLGSPHQLRCDSGGNNSLRHSCCNTNHDDINQISDNELRNSSLFHSKFSASGAASFSHFLFSRFRDSRRERVTKRKMYNNSLSLVKGLILLVIVASSSVFIPVVESVCVWQGGSGFKVACGFRQSGLFRLRSIGGIKGYVGAGFTIGDENGFKDSLTNTEPKQSGAYVIPNNGKWL